MTPRPPDRLLSRRRAVAAALVGVAVIVVLIAGLATTGAPAEATASRPAGAPAGSAASTSSSSSTTTTTSSTSSSTAPSASGNRPPPVVVPQGLSPSVKTPLVIAMWSGVGFNPLASRDGFRVAYLSTVDKWKNDLAYISSEIDQLEATYNIDPNRVYVTGFSGGGWATLNAGCYLSRKIAAIAVVDSTMTTPVYTGCSPVRPVSELLISGTAQGSLYSGLPGRLASAAQTTGRWLGLNGCPNTAAPQVTHSGVVTQQLWTRCTDSSAVGFYTVKGAGHYWPGSVGIPASDPGATYNAYQAVWSFFSARTAAPMTLPGSLSTLVFRTRQSVVRTRGRARKTTVRQVVATFALGEAVKVSAQLLSGTKVVLAKRAPLARGRRTSLVWTLPRRVRPGSYMVALSLVDSFGRRLAIAPATLQIH